MRLTSVTSPMLTLPHDALNEIALRLPADKSIKPWRDVNSLATTCKGLYYWKKTVVNKKVETEWERVSAGVAKNTGWRDYLEKILSDFEHPSRRLFREPVLRKIAKLKEPKTTAEPKTSLYEFQANLFIQRETATLKEISSCLILCSDDGLESHKKIDLVKKFPSFLSTPKNTDKQKALRMMLNLLFVDKTLTFLIKVNDILKSIEASLGDDPPSKALWELGLRSRGLLTNKPDLGASVFNLEFSPDAEHWNWVLNSVPEFLNTTIGMQIFLNHTVCRPKMIAYLNRIFSECESELARFANCEKVSEVYSQLCECSDGKNLAKKIVRDFLKAPLFRYSDSVHLTRLYVDLLSKHVTLVKAIFGKKEKKMLCKLLVNAIRHATIKNSFDQSTSILMALARDDIKLLKNLTIGLVPIAALTHALSHAKSIESLDIRYSYVSALYKAASLYREVDPEFVNDFYDDKEAIKWQMKAQATT